MCLSMLRDSTSVDVKLCKIQKTTNFTHFALKIFHISLFKTVYIYTFATVTMHICVVTVNVYPIILLISCSLLFFLSLLCAQRTQWLLLSLSSFSLNTHKHTHTQTNPHGQTNRETNRCLTGTISAWSMLVGQREWVLMLAAEIGAWLEWFSACASIVVGRCLWQRWCLRRLKGQTQVEEIWPRGAGGFWFL